eukprot:2428798-Rhodomonas_salina.1
MPQTASSRRAKRFMGKLSVPVDHALPNVPPSSPAAVSFALRDAHVRRAMVSHSDSGADEKRALEVKLRIGRGSREWCDCNGMGLESKIQSQVGGMRWKCVAHVRRLMGKLARRELEESAAATGSPFPARYLPEREPTKSKTRPDRDYMIP